MTERAPATGRETTRPSGSAGDHRDVVERGEHRRTASDPESRPEPYASGPTGPAPLATELRGDPGAEGDREAEGGTATGVVAGTAMGGPIGGVIGGVVGATIGSVADDDPGADAPGATAESTPGGDR